MTALRSLRRRRMSRPSILLTLVSAITALLFIVPAAWMLASSFRTNTQIFGSLTPLSWDALNPFGGSFENYTALLVEGQFGKALLNSVIVCVATVAIGIVLAALAAYALAVLDFPGRGFVFIFVVLSFMVPFEAIAIPLSSLFVEWGLANTLSGLILPAIGNGLAIFNLRQFFLGVPPSYREAALIDGASEPRILFSIYVPLGTGTLVNSALLIFLGQWTSYLWPLITIRDQSLQVAPIALAKTFTEHGVEFGQTFAGAILLSLVPAILLFILQRSFGRTPMGSGEK